MIHDVVMPQLGMTMTEGFVMQWLKAIGDPIEKGEPLFIVQTDKVDMDVEAMQKGFVTEILVDPEVTVPVGTVIARIGDSLESRQRLLVSPRAKRVAQELGVDLTSLKGSGEFGRIREADVRAVYVPKPAAPAPAPASPRRQIAERMEESVRTIPQFWLRREVDASHLVQMRDQLLPVVEARDGIRLSFTDFMLKALAVGLTETPSMNAAWREGKVEQRQQIDLGFAAQGTGRLLVPVIRGVDRLTLVQIAKQRAELADRAKSGKLKPDEMQGASSTLSNLGAFGVDEFEALINPPESCILAAGRIAPRPFAVEGTLVARPTLRLTLSVDHRVADGVLAATFLNAVAKALEQPATMLI